MEGVTVIDHPLVQHKLTLMRDKETLDAAFRQLLQRDRRLLCYEVTRDLPLEEVEIETPLAPMKAPKIAGKKLVFASILRAGNGLAGRHARPRALGARRAYRHLPRSGDAAAGRILLQGAGRNRRAAGHRASTRCSRPRIPPSRRWTG